MKTIDDMIAIARDAFGDGLHPAGYRYENGRCVDRPLVRLTHTGSRDVELNVTIFTLPALRKFSDACGAADISLEGDYHAGLELMTIRIVVSWPKESP